MKRRSISLLAVAVLVAGLVTATSPRDSADALQGSQFDPGFIISDQNFFNGAAMSASEVQTFLNQRVPTCTGANCLKGYVQATPSMAADAFCSAYAGSSSESAASIIAKVGQACNISQKVILVLLQKEQSLVTSTNPTTNQYNKATGYSCPDTAACNPAFSGFFYQVYYAARQYQRYATYPSSYNYRAGQVNNVLYHPNAACGSAPVFIANQATAGLYNYTPYQPNTAALNNLYGTGDSCSSYGNRNFWRLYWDWFGSPVTDADLLRTSSNPLVYLISGNVKYPITSYETYSALLPLGGPGFVSQGYLDGFTTGVNVGQTFRSPGGAIAVFDRSTFYNFTSCDQLAHFGYNCSVPTWVQLDSSQWSTFTQGPSLTNVVGTVSGARWGISNGVRTEFVDITAQISAGYPNTTVVVLNDSAVAHLTVGNPGIRDNIIVLDRASRDAYAYFNGALHAISRETAQAIGASTLAAGSLSTASLSKLAQDPDPVGSRVTDDEGRVWQLSAAGRMELEGAPVAGLTAVPDGFLDLFTNLGRIQDGSIVKGDVSSTVYLYSDGVLRRFGSWAALESIAVGTPTITTVPQRIVDLVPTGGRMLTSGTLVRTASDPTIYLIDGESTKIKVRSFATAAEAGFVGFTTVADADLAGYQTSANVLGYGYRCNGTKYIANQGVLRPVSPALEAAYNVPYIDVSETLCAHLASGTAMTSRIRTPDGAIYEVDAQGKHKYSYSRWVAAGSFTDFINVSAEFAQLLPTGDPA